MRGDTSNEFKWGLCQKIRHSISYKFQNRSTFQDMKKEQQNMTDM